MSSSVNSISRSFSRIFSRPSGARTGSWRQKSMVGVFASEPSMSWSTKQARSFMSSSAPGKPAAAAHVEVRRVEQDLAAVGELELDVAEDLALALGDVQFDLALRHALLGLVHELFGHGGALLLVGEDGREVGLAGLLPLEHVERLG